MIADDLTGTGSPASLDYPTGLAHDVANDRVLVQLVALDTLAAVDLATGNRTVISSDEVGVGPAFMFENSLAFDATINVAYVVDSGVDALYVIDVESGDRVILSK